MDYQPFTNCSWNSLLNTIGIVIETRISIVFRNDNFDICEKIIVEITKQCKFHFNAHCNQFDVGIKIRSLCHIDILRQCPKVWICGKSLRGNAYFGLWEGHFLKFFAYKYKLVDYFWHKITSNQKEQLSQSQNEDGGRVEDLASSCEGEIGSHIGCLQNSKLPISSSVSYPQNWKLRWSVVVWYFQLITGPVTLAYDLVREKVQSFATDFPVECLSNVSISKLTCHTQLLD